MKHLLRLWFGVSMPIDRRTYAMTGFGLMALKYAFDVGVVYAAIGRFWSPLEFLSPFYATREPLVARAGGYWLPLVLFISALPLMWIGLSMTTRRAIDAGKSGWVGMLFLVPFVNWIAALVLCVLPSVARDATLPAPDRAPTFTVELAAAAAGGVLGLVLTAFGIFVVQHYGVAVFVGVPFVMGFVTTYLLQRRATVSFRRRVVVGQMSLLVAGGAMLALGLEGVVCLAMAYPPGSVAVLLGGELGAMVAGRTGLRPGYAVVMLLAAPLLMGAEAVDRRVPLRHVTTTIEIDAPPSAVWPSVVAFETLPPPSELVFRLGIAYPIGARIEGTGVGAVRRCRFSTGEFVEPITVWDEPRLLAFDVLAQPEPMKELSPYEAVNAPHLLEGFRSERGEFRLTALPGGRTRIDGTTWYALDLWPQAYWTLWSDGLIHRIHVRVLRHIRAEVEGVA